MEPVLQQSISRLKPPFTVSKGTKARGHRKGMIVRKSQVEDLKKKSFLEMCKQHRKKVLGQVFISKLKHTMVRSQIDQDYIQSVLNEEHQEDFLKPLKMPKIIEIILMLITILQVLVYFILSTFALTFSQVNGCETIQIIVGVCLLIHIISILSRALFLNQMKIQEQTHTQSLKDLIGEYASTCMIIDIVLMIIFILDICQMLENMPWLRLLILFKVKSTAKMIKVLEIQLLDNCYQEQYWQLVKVFIFNFIFAHLIGLILIIIASDQQGTNWVKKNGFQTLPWFQKYIWSYYWAINIMLTVGFGDISATTTTEAGALIFIQTFSCIVLAYNINIVGGILKNINSYDEQKEKNIKTFARMRERGDLSNDLKKKMKNFINQSINMKRKYNIQEQSNLLESFPKPILQQYKKQANKKIFQDLPFFNFLSSKYISKIAVNIQRRLAHPQEIIINHKTIPNIVIAKGGELGLSICRPGYKIHSQVMQKIKLGKNDHKLLSLDFLLKKELNYDVRCLDYSLIYQITFQKLAQILKTSPYNFQFLCMKRDKDRFNLNQFGNFSCNRCGKKQRHTVFQCPQFHFVPINQHIINKFNKKANKPIYHVSSEIRKSIPKVKFNPLHHFALWNSQQTNYDSYSIDQVQESLPHHSHASISKKRVRKSTKLSGFERMKKNKATFILALEHQASKLENLIKNNKFFEWDVECDLARDFLYYFPSANPSQLCSRLTNEKLFKKWGN